MENNKVFLQLFYNAIRQSKINSLSTDIEWVEIYKLANRHNISAMIYDVAVNMPGYNLMPENLKAYWKTESINVTTRQIQNTDSLLQVLKLFRENGISAIVMKGLACRILYPNLEQRMSVDEDILIHQRDFLKCAKLLKSIGYVQEIYFKGRNMSEIQEISFFELNRSLRVELHVNAIGKEDTIRRKLNSYTVDVFKNIQLVNINGTYVQIMGPTDQVRMLMMHFFKHFISCGIGILQVCDIMLCIEKYQNEIDWQKVRIMLEDISAIDLFQNLLGIAINHMGMNEKILPDFLRTNNLHHEELLEDILNAGSFGFTSEARILSREYTIAAVNDACSNDKKNNIWLIRLFPPKSKIISKYPILVKCPWLLPMIWIGRAFAFARSLFNGHRSVSDITESSKIGQERIELLKKYKVIKEHDITT